MFLRIVALCLLLTGGRFTVTAQRTTAPSDLQLIAAANRPDSQEAHYYKRAGNDRQVLSTQHHSVLASYNPVALALKGTMYLYQQVLSPELARQCPYGITCSNFSKQAIHEFGLVKGVFLSADRLTRCTRIGILDVSPLDFDPVTGTITDPPSKYK